MTHLRLDLLLVQHHGVRSRAEAREYIDEGRVSVNGVVARKASQRVDLDSEVTILPDAERRYASRAGYKLAGVLDDLGPLDAPMIEGARCLDIGASTGGFTDVLLRHGAGSVVAIDVGHDQLRADLRADPRVEVHEGMNARYLDAQQVAPAPTIAVADVSFISLTLIIPAIVPVLTDEARILFMVKPQFEVGRERLGSDGVVHSAGLHEQSIAQVADCLIDNGVSILNIVASRLPGPHGNREFFIHGVKDVTGFPQFTEEREDMIRLAVQSTV